MTHRPTPSPSQLQYYDTAAYPCSYIEGRIARSQVAGPREHIDNVTYSELIRQGFRRSGDFVYRPHCDHCQACKSIRVSVTEFRPNKSQLRALKKHSNLAVSISKPHFSEEHYDLYQRYQKARHTDGGMDDDDVAHYVEFLVNTRVDTYMVEFREPACDGSTNKLRMVSIIDQLSDGLSAVYTFFEPLDGQSYGTFNVLWQIECAQSLGLAYVYLGYWIQTCRKMSYKIHFQPSELLSHGNWTRPDLDSPSLTSLTPFFTL